MNNDRSLHMLRGEGDINRNSAVGTFMMIRSPFSLRIVPQALAISTLQLRQNNSIHETLLMKNPTKNLHVLYFLNTARLSI